MDSSRPRDYAAAAKLQELRESRGWSPEQVCFELKAHGLPLVSGKTIRRIEDHGSMPRVDTATKLAEVLGLSTSAFIAALRGETVDEVPAEAAA